MAGHWLALPTAPAAVAVALDGHLDDEQVRDERRAVLEHLRMRLGHALVRHAHQHHVEQHQEGREVAERVRVANRVAEPSQPMLWRRAIALLSLPRPLVHCFVL